MISVSCSNCGKQFQNIDSKLAGKKAKCSCGSMVRIGMAKPAPQPAATGMPATPVKTRRREPNLGIDSVEPKLRGDNRGTNDATGGRLVVEDTYCDLDAILEGAGDASPVVAAPGKAAASSRDPKSQQANRSGPTNESGQSRINGLVIGFVAALGSATLGFWFGTLIVVIRFHQFRWIGLDRFSQNLRSANLASFGDGDVSSTQTVIFVTLGWLLWVAGLFLIMVAMAQLINAFSKLVLGKQLAGWSDGAAATVGVVTVFLMVALMFAQLSFRQGQQQALNEFERPAVFEGEHLPHVERARQEYDESNRSFNVSILVGALFPMSIFILSSIRLFVKSPDENHNPNA